MVRELPRQLNERTTEIKALNDEVSKLLSRVSKLGEKVLMIPRHMKGTLVFSREAIPQFSDDENCTLVAGTLSMIC